MSHNVRKMFIPEFLHFRGTPATFVLPSARETKMSLADDAVSVTENIHLYMVTLLGVLFTFVLLACWLLLAFKPSIASVLRWVNLALCVLQAFITIFFWFNPIWIIALQLLVVAVFGIFALITNSADHILVFVYLSLFNTLVCFGKLQFMGYSVNLLDAPVIAANCEAYYGTSDSDAICYGYINYLRFLAFSLILMQPLETFFAYLTYKAHTGEGQRGLLGGYGNISDKQPAYEGSEGAPSHS